MKKLVFLIFIVTVLYLGFINNNSQAGSEDDIQVIPDDAIRLRILAHSDDEKDQEIKHLVRDKVSEQISEWVEHMTDIDDARRSEEHTSELQSRGHLVCRLLLEKKKKKKEKVITEC